MLFMFIPFQNSSTGAAFEAKMAGKARQIRSLVSAGGCRLSSPPMYADQAPMNADKGKDKPWIVLLLLSKLSAFIGVSLSAFIDGEKAGVLSGEAFTINTPPCLPRYARAWL
jgi:hypothetical protein